MAKKETQTLNSKKETEKILTATRMFRLRCQCEAIAKAKACGFDDDMKIKRQGQRAMALWEDTIGVESEEIKSRIQDYSKKHFPSGKVKQSEMASHPDLKEMLDKQEELQKREATFVFIPVSVDVKRWEDKYEDFSEAFKSSTEIVTVKDQQFELDPYEAFQQLIEEGFIKITKNEENGKD